MIKRALHRLDQLTILPPEPLRWLSEQQIIYLLIRLVIWRSIILVGQTYCSFFDIQKVQPLRLLYKMQAENMLLLSTKHNNIEYQKHYLFDSNDCQTGDWCWQEENHTRTANVGLHVRKRTCTRIPWSIIWHLKIIDKNQHQLKWVY